MTTELIHRTLRTDKEVEQISRRIGFASANAVVAYDTETGAAPGMHELFDKPELHPYVSCYLTGISVCLVTPRSNPLDRAEGFYVPVGHKHGNVSPAAVRSLCRALTLTRAHHVLHHAPFDWAVLAEAGHGFVPQRRVIDTQVAHWLHDENMPKALKVLGEMYLDEDAGREQRELHEAMLAPYPKIGEARAAVLEAYPELGWIKGKGKVVRPNEEAERMAQQLKRNRKWGELTVDELGPYAANDATLTARFAYDFLGRARILRPERPLQREMDLQHVLYGMTKRGVSVDIDKFEVAGKEYARRADWLDEQYNEAYGFALRQRFGKKEGERLNLGSADQMQWLLFEHCGLPIKLRTEGGAPATGKDALEMLEGDPTAAGVLEYRRWVKARTSYAEPYARFATYSSDGRVHGHYSSTRTVTGRLSASGPNVMQIPREDSLPEIRAAFYKVPPGIERIGFDIVSAELWVTASITKDPVLTDTLMAGANLHVEMMKQVFGIEDKKSRFYTLSKNVNFGIEYGAGLDQIAKFAAKAGFGPDESYAVAARARDGHKRLFARQHYVADFLAEKARERGSLPLHVPGRFRHFRTPGVAVGYYTALNALVQGGVAEYMKDTMLELRGTPWEEMLVLQVHDELVFDAPIGSRDAIHATLTEISNRINPFRYPLRWEAKAWSDVSPS